MGFPASAVRNERAQRFQSAANSIFGNLRLLPERIEGLKSEVRQALIERGGTTVLFIVRVGSDLQQIAQNIVSSRKESR